MKRIFEKYGLLSLVLVLGLSAMVITFGVSAALPPGPSASGHGTLLVADEDSNDVRRQFSFSAKERADGTVAGNAVLHNPAFLGADGKPYQAHIDISCMQVVGNIAIFGGIVRKTNDPNLEGAVFFSVQDNGEPGGGNDKISSAFFWDDDPTTVGDPQACTAIGPDDFPLHTIENGNIQVRP